MYSISVQDGSATAVYKPCEIVTIALDVLNVDYKYIGLLLYAVRDDGTNEKVGTFALPPGDDMFWTPGGCQDRAVMHRNAGQKKFHHEFRWRAPKAGTGRVRFHALVKRGETNTGEFYWPRPAVNLANGGGGGGNQQQDDLVLEEEPPARRARRPVEQRRRRVMRISLRTHALFKAVPERCGRAESRSSPSVKPNAMRRNTV